MKVSKLFKQFTMLLLVSVFFLNLNSGHAQAAEKVLNVSAYNQEKSNWCWAAAGQAIIQYKKQYYTQCTLYKKGKNYSACTTNEQGSIYTQFDNMFEYANFTAMGGVIFQPAGWSYITAQINLYRPLLARIEWSSGGGHFAVVKGYTDGTTDYVHWTDIKQSGSYSRKTTYSYFKSNSNFDWTTTRYGMY